LSVRRPAFCAFLLAEQATYNAAMEISQPTSPVNLEIISASLEQQSIVANLLELYIYDFSEFMDLKLGGDGRFGYEPLPLYWQDPGRYPFLIQVDGHWAGFIFVRRGSQISGDEKVWDMAEFFIVRGYRRLGIGTRVAHTIWRRFPGNWEVRVSDRNQKARDFWGGAIREFIGATIQSVPFKKGDKDWSLFSFESQRAES
jgi:predicted acetyltransferase